MTTEQTLVQIRERTFLEVLDLAIDGGGSHSVTRDILTRRAGPW